MFINDDGMQIIDEDERQARIDFYADHSIGWTARPKHGKDGFTRKGKFKKVCQSISRQLSFVIRTLRIQAHSPYTVLWLPNQGSHPFSSSTKLVPVTKVLPQ